MGEGDGPFERGRLGGERRSVRGRAHESQVLPAEYHSQAPLWIALDLRKKVRAEGQHAIDIQTYYTAWKREIGSEPKSGIRRRARPRTTACLTSRARVDGRGHQGDSFSEKRMRDRRCGTHAAHQGFGEPEFTREFRRKLVTRIESDARGAGSV